MSPPGLALTLLIIISGSTTVLKIAEITAPVASLARIVTP
jgi:hypothetical protein